MKDYLALINIWYQSKCNGVWEHSYGFSLDNIDNPGWRIKITGEHSKQHLNIVNNIESDENWLSIQSNDNTFIGYSGVLSFCELLEYVINWLEITEL